jgi:glycosyltransferase involved in cell wall biosynthesis
MNPQITVIIPAYRRKNYLFYALDRILSQKNVTMEILVFSEVMEPDEVDEVEIAYPQVKYFKTDKYKGASEKRRAGIKMSQGKYLYMPDDDDYLTDDMFLFKALDVLESDQKLSLAAANTSIIHEYADANKNFMEQRDLGLEGRINGIEYLQGLQVTMNKPISSVSILFRKQVFIDRNVDAMFEISDIPMYMNALVWGDAYILPETSAIYRFHEKNMTYHLSFPFMFNVLREKERVYRDVKKVIPLPQEFWYNHFKISYLFFKDGNAFFMGKVKMLLWGFIHGHKNKQLIAFLSKELVKCFMGR